MLASKDLSNAQENFRLFKPSYRKLELFSRYLAIIKILLGTAWIVSKSKLFNNRIAFGASLEITDRCNAGCSYCYVYPEEWDQSKRVKGYLKLDPSERFQKTNELFDILDRLSSEGKVLVTLVGGEPTLAPTLIKYASTKIPVVWVVTNGTKPLPWISSSVIYFVSVDGPPEFHNRSRDPANFFNGIRYKDLNGISAAVVKNINESKNGAYVHITLTKSSMIYFKETVNWLCKDVSKLRGIVVSGAATTSINDPSAIAPGDRLEIKRMIEELALQYGWDLFPFNTPAINSYLFEPENLIYSPHECTIARRVDSFDFSGQSTGKCVLRDEIDCQTCVCNLTGLMRGVSSFDPMSMRGILSTCFG